MVEVSYKPGYSWSKKYFLKPCKERPVWKTASYGLGQSSANDIIKTAQKVAASDDGL